ncbi:hypothetical protein Scep_021695 [Stephania cephalantha]|uniref:Uncharacterized protein n=1 Tax=Stephania cephalantha TaxID=152367 RepID=A0AAP0I1L2_9MAGN
MTSSARSSTNRLRSSIQPAIEEIPDFSRLPTVPTEGENSLIHLIAEHGLLYPSSVAAEKMSLVFKSGYLKERWKWKYVPQSQRDIYWHRCSSLGTCKCHLRYMKRGVGRQPSDEAFKKKSEVGGPDTGISLHSAGSISARQHGDTLEKKLKRRPTRKDMFRHLHTHGHDGQTFVDQRSAKIDSPDTSIDEDAVYLEVVSEVKGRVYGLGSQGYHHSISSREASSSRGPAYGPHELEELQRDHQRLQETLLKERMKRQEQMQRDKMERQEENREIQDRLARMEALLMQHLGIRPHVPPTPRPPLSPVTERSGPQSDDQPGHLTTDRAPSQSAHLDDHQPGHWTDPHREMPEDRHHLLDDHDEFMYVQRWHLVLVLLTEKELTRLLYFCWLSAVANLSQGVFADWVPVNDIRCLSMNSNKVAIDSVFADWAQSATYAFYH